MRFCWCRCCDEPRLSFRWLDKTKGRAQCMLGACEIAYQAVVTLLRCTSDPCIMKEEARALQQVMQPVCTVQNAVAADCATTIDWFEQLTLTSLQ